MKLALIFERLPAAIKRWGAGLMQKRTAAKRRRTLASCARQAEAGVPDLDAEGLEAIRSAISALNRETNFIELHPRDLLNVLQARWTAEDGIQPEEQVFIGSDGNRYTFRKPEIASEAEKIPAIPGTVFGTTRFSVAKSHSQSSWLLIMTKEFVNSITGMDRKLQGRILVALTEISTGPLEPRGDTVKPLSKDLKGMWRYRLGDFRLIYQPVPEESKVFLLELSARSEAY